MRWWKKAILIGLAAIVVIGLAGWFYLFKMHGLEDIATSRLNSLLSRSMPVEVSVGSISGNIISELVLENVSVRFKDTLADYQFFGATKISLAYSLKGIWTGNYSLKYLVLDSASFHLRKDSSGALILPIAKKAAPDTTAGAKPGGIPDFSVDELLLSQCAVLLDGPSDTLAFDSIFFDGAVKADQGTVALDLHQASAVSNKAAFSVPGLSGKITFADGSIIAQDVLLVRGASRTKVSGTYDLKAKIGQLAFNFDDVDIDEIGRMVNITLTGKVDAYGNIVLLPDSLSGTVSLGGKFMMAELDNLTTRFSFAHQLLKLDTLYGTILGDCAVDGKGQINFGVSPEQYSVDLNMKGFDLKQMVPASFTTDLNGLVHLDGESFRNKTLVLRINTSLYESEFDEYPIQKGAGQIVVTTDSVTFPTPFAVSYFENQFTVQGRVDYSNDMDLGVIAHLNNLDRYRGKLFIDQPGGRGYGEATLTGRTSEPDLKGFFSSDSLWLYGMYSDTFDVTYNIERFLTGQHGAVVARAIGGKLWNVPFDTVFAVLGLDSNLVHADSLAIISPNGSLNAWGEVDHSVYPQQIDIDSLRLTVFDQTLYNQGPISIAMDSTGFSFVKSAIGSGGSMLMALGRLNFDETMKLALSVNDVPIKTWARLYRDDFPSDGKASFQADVSGSFHDPVFRVYGKIDSLYYKDLLLGDVRYAGSFDNHLCDLDSVVLSSHPGIYHASGQFSADIDLTADTLARLINQPFDIHVVAQDSRFDLVPVFLPKVEALDGHFETDFRLFGTPNSPHLEGSASMIDGKLKYFDLANWLHCDTATVLMKDNQIIADGFVAYVEDPRRPSGRSEAKISGAITVKSLDNFNYDLHISIPKEMTVLYELADIQAVVTGDLYVLGDTPPTVTGDLAVLSARYNVNFATADEGSPLMELLTGDQTWDMNINLDIPSNYWIKNDDIDAELSGQMNLIREKGSWRFIGIMEIIRGRGFLFDKTFTDLSGTISYDNINELNPTLDITGFTRIAGLAQNESGSQAAQEVGIRVTGTLENPDINTVAPAGSTAQTYSREELLPLLLADYSPNDPANTKEISKLGLRLQSVVGQQVSQVGTRQLGRLGVETFEIDPYNNGKFDLLKSSVTLGFSGSRLSVPNLYVYGKPVQSGKVLQEYGFEYRFNRTMLLEGQRDQDQLYHLDLKLHWEF